MPSHYLYYCTNGHEEMRYRNAQKCRICGAEVDRRDAPTPDLSTLERYQKLQEEHAALLAEVARLREALTLTPEKIEAAAKAQYEFDNPGGPEFKACTFRCLYLGASRAALLAAGMTEEALQ